MDKLMNKAIKIFTSAHARSKKAVVSLALAAAMVFTTNSQASARVYDAADLMQNYDELISLIAHPSAEFVRSDNEGNGVLAITYRSIWTGDYLTMRLQGHLDSSGTFNRLTVLSDQGKICAFCAADAAGQVLNSVLSKANSNNELNNAQRWGIKMAIEAMNRNDAETALEKFLYAASI